MSVKISAMVFEGGPRLLAQHSVMLALADNADDFGVAWPGLELLAEKSRMSVRNLTRVLEALEREGWLVKRARARGEHRRGSVYELNLARLSGTVRGAEMRGGRGKSKAEGRRVERFVSRETSSAAGNLSPLDTLASHATDAVADAGGYGAPLDTVSDAAAEVQSAVATGQPRSRDWTTSAPRLDMALADLLLGERDAFQNRQEPPLEPPLPPKPPHGGGVARGGDAARESTACGLDAARGKPELRAYGGARSFGKVFRVAPTPEEADEAELAEELAEMNAMRARRKLPPFSREAWLAIRAEEQRIANPADPVPVRSRRRRRR